MVRKLIKYDHPPPDLSETIFHSVILVFHQTLPDRSFVRSFVHQIVAKLSNWQLDKIRTDDTQHLYIMGSVVPQL